MRPIVLLLACAAIVACGTDDGGGEGAGGYRERVERLCREADRDAKRLAEEAGESIDEAIGFFAKALRQSRRDQERFEAIDPPEELAEQHERSVELGRQGIEILDRLVQSLRASDDPLAVLRKQFPPLARLVDKSNQLAREMKLDDCVAEPVSPAPTPKAPS